MFVQVERRPSGASFSSNYKHVRRVDVEKNEGTRAAAVYVFLIEIFHRIAAIVISVAHLRTAQ